MKKIWIICIILYLTGCGSEELNFDKNKAQNTIEKNLSQMVEVKETTLSNVYEIDLSLIDEYIIKENSSGDFYAILLTKNKLKVKEQMDIYFEKIRDSYVAYVPENVEKLDNRIEKEIDEYLIYIVAQNASLIYDEIINTME